jgi:hypothetical protein
MYQALGVSIVARQQRERFTPLRGLVRRVAPNAFSASRWAGRRSAW